METMTDKQEWRRPQDVAVFRTKDPNQMLGKYLTRRVLKTWHEDFIDEDTGETVTVERNCVIMEPSLITQEVLQELMFAIQAGDIEDVEVCDENVREIRIVASYVLKPYSLELEWFDKGVTTKDHYVCYAHNINQAIRIATEFGQMYRGLSGGIDVKRVARMDARLVPDDHPCIPEDDRMPAAEDKNYFKVQVRTEWIEIECDRPRKSDVYYIIHSRDVGEAKERIARLLDIQRAEQEEEYGNSLAEPDSIKNVIRKAAPFEVNCVVPKEFSELYEEEVAMRRQA